MKTITSFLFFLFLGFQSFAACELYDLTVTRSDCNKDNKFSVTINFKYHNVSDCFTVKGNGKNYGTFKYSKLPITIDGLMGDCHTEYEFVIRDCVHDGCALEYILGVVCCETHCEFSDLHLEKTDCDEHGQFCVFLNFKYSGNSKCFKVTGNGHDYGKFSYSQLPLKICGLNGDCETEYEFVVTDCEDPECSIAKELGIVCCEKVCKLYDLKLEKTNCNDHGEFFVFLNFKYNDTSSCFIVKVNGTVYGTYHYYQLPVKLGPFKGDCKTNYEFTVIDCEDEKCHVGKALGVVCCEEKKCEIKQLKITKTDCDKENNFCVIIDFKYSGTSTCFKVKGNGVNYGTFDYTQLPIKICGLKGDCKKIYEFLIIDCENEKCKAAKSIGKVCCEFHKDDKKDLKKSNDIQVSGQYENWKPAYTIDNKIYDILQSRETVQIRFNQSGMTFSNYALYNCFGTEIKRNLIQTYENSLEVQTSSLLHGLYFLKVQTGEEDLLIRFVK